MRGRRYKKRTGLLLVVSEPCALQQAAKAIPGIDTRVVSRINAEALAPGTQAGRATLFTDASLKIMEEKKLFL